MNNAGLPGTGLGGLFYVALALSMPVVELVRTLRGHGGGADRWHQVAIQFAMACGIIASVVGSTAVLLLVADAPNPFGLDGGSVLLAPVVLAAALLIVLIAVLRTWAWFGAADRGRA